MKFAVIKTGGKQHLVSPGSILKVEKLAKPEAEGEVVAFNEVLLLADGENVIVGKPFVTGATVTAQLLEEGRAKKITVFKFKSKTRYRKKIGHRQHYAKIKIEEIVTPDSEKRS